MYRVASIEQTCSACPSQWEGYTDQEQEVYVRYRWGYLRVEVSGEVIFGKQLVVDDEDDTDFSYLDPEMAARMKESDRVLREMNAKLGLGHSYSGTLSYDELKAATVGVLEWPELDFDPKEWARQHMGEEFAGKMDELHKLLDEVRDGSKEEGNLESDRPRLS